ncbi:MAG: extracellular solute-binding protein [Anaerolineales bacterium]|nr:extracellular solute-binding protein [Anaerolineales bacterium]
MKRWLFIFVIILALLLGSCAPEPPAEEVAPAEEAAPAEAEEAVEPAEEAMDAVEIRFAYYADGNEADVMQGLIDGFMADNPGISVVLDVVPYATIDEQLPVQVETGEGPDMARITNFGAYGGKLLDLRDYLSGAAFYEANFPAPILSALGYGGFPDAFTVTGPYVNVTLFEQAGMEVLGEGATWADWTEATKAVAEATGVQYAISIDRTGHRYAGPALSMGATLIDDAGDFVVTDPGFGAFAEVLNGWHVDGITPNEVWLVGDSLNSCIDFFKSGDLVMCMSGSWQINGLAADVGDAFDWAVVPNPTGDGGSTGVAGGSAVVAFGDTEHPEVVAKLMEYLVQTENYSAFSAGTLALPAHTGAAAAGVDFQTDNASVLGALAGFTAEVPKLADAAVGLNVHPFAFAYYRNSANRIGQYLTGELTLDQALDRMQGDIDAAIAEAKGETPAMEAVELRFTYYADGVEADVMQPLLDAFMADNPDITVVLDVVPYDTIDQQLPVQVETGEGPDLARITNFGAYAGKLLDLRDYMADAAYYEANFAGPILSALGYGGFPDSFTVTGPYVNVTLFEQAGVDLLGEGATWAEWTEATKAVAEATGVQYAISIDRTGHRFAGPALSMGATLIDADGNFTVNEPGFGAFAEVLNGWHVDGITPSEVWLVGDSLNSCIDFFKSGDLVMCMSGSWQINGLANDVGDAFDWAVVPNPTGDGGSTGVAGGSAVVAFGDTEYPEAVGRLMEYLVQAETYAQFSAGTLALPAHTGAASAGIDFQTDNASVLGALAGFTAEVPKLNDAAVGLNVHPYAFAYYRNSANRIAQYLTGELTLDEALERLQQDIDDAIAEAGG